MADRRTIGPRKILRLTEKKHDKTIKSEKCPKKSNRKKENEKIFPCTRHAMKQIVN